MVDYTCPKCKKIFKQRGHYTSHLNRKTPCDLNNLSKEKTAYKVVDLFAGAGGLTNGFYNKNYDILFGVEHDKYAAQTYSANFSHPLYCQDIRELKTEELVEKYGKADIVIGGPPCQGFSMAGRRDTKDPRNSLFMDYLRFVKDFEPKYFIMENVPGILTMKTEANEKVVDILHQEISKIGYNVKWKILLACDYGTPQKRKRVIFMGWKNDIAEPNFPNPTNSLENYVCMKDVLLDKKDVPQKYYHSQKMIDGFRKRKAENKKNGKGFGAQFIKENEPCYTISARYYKDGSDALVYYSDSEIRKLTEKEVAKIQGFPENFIFPCSSVQTYKQIGNAVAGQLSIAIANSLLEVLQEVN
jgi:DNA (cytosine-5)-methyltransferase 1